MSEEERAQYNLITWLIGAVCAAGSAYFGWGLEGAGVAIGFALMIRTISRED